MLALLLLGFLSGVAFMLALLLVVILYLTNIYQGTSLPNPVKTEEFTPSQIPKSLAEFCAESVSHDSSERADVGVNLVLMFLFQEMKNTDQLRKWFKEKVEVELQEIKCHPALRYVLRDLRLKSFDLGSSLPMVKLVKVNTEPEVKADGRIETLDLILDISYSGQATVSLHALVSFDRNLMFSCKVMSLSGQGRLRFTRHPYTNWSFSFISEPTISLDLKSNVNGRSVPQVIIPLLTNQIKRVIRKKHTLPAYKIRIKPFFGAAMYTQSVSRRLPNLSQALEVIVVSASRLVFDYANSSGIFAVISSDSEKYLPKLPYTEHSTTVMLSGPPNQRANGLSIKKSTHRLTKKDAIIVDKVKQGSAAGLAGLVKGDIITHINSELLTIMSSSHTKFLLTDPSAESVLVTLSRCKSPKPELSNQSESPPVKVENSTQSIANSEQADSEDSSVYIRDKEKRKRSRSPDRESTSLISSITSRSLRVSATSRITSTVSTEGPEAIFSDKFDMKLESQHLYVNIALFSINSLLSVSANGAEDSLIGYTSVSVPDILGQCSSSPTDRTQISVRLSPPPDLDHNPAMIGAREMDISKCYGDITLEFYAPEYKQSDAEPPKVPDAVEDSEFADVDIVPPVANLSTQAAPFRTDSDTDSLTASFLHSFRDQAFTQAISCNFCSKKIWMKKAVKCDECHMIIHKKCIARCQTSTTCSREPIIQLASSRESISSHLPEEHPRKLSRTSSSAFGKLRRRKNRNKSGEVGQPPNQPNLNAVTKSTIEGFESSSDEEQSRSHLPHRSNMNAADSLESSSEDDAEFEIQFMKDYLSKQGGQSAQEENSDELVIIAAKQMGKELFASLEIEERKTKLEAMVEKLQLEIQMVSNVRDEHHRSLKSSATAPQRQLISSRIKKADEKMQALAVLLVHYYSGLQDCAEQIEKGNYSTLKRNGQNADFDGSSNHQLEGSMGGTWDNEPSVKLDQQSTDSSSMDSSSLEQQVKPMSDPVAIPHTVSPSLKNS